MSPAQKDAKKKSRVGWILLIVSLLVLAAMIFIKVPYYIAGYGNIMSIKDAVLRAGTKGMIDKIYIESGDMVKKGEVLIQLEDSIERAELAENQRKLFQERARLAQLKANIQVSVSQQKAMIELGKIKLRDADYDYNRVKSLFAQKAASKTEMERTTIQRDLAQAELKRVSIDQKNLHKTQIEVQRKKIEVLESSIELAKSKLALRKVRAPLSGRVVLHALSIGQIVDADQVLGQIFDEKSHQIIARIPEKFLWFIKPDTKILVEPSAYPHRDFGYITGKISWVSPVVSPSSSGDGMVVVKAKIDDSNKKIALKPGISCKIWVSTGKVPIFYYLSGLRKFN